MEVMEGVGIHQRCLSCKLGYLIFWGPFDHLPFEFSGTVEGKEFVGQLQHEAVLVVDNAEEVLETDFFCGYWNITPCCDLGLKGHDS